MATPQRNVKWWRTRYKKWFKLDNSVSLYNATTLKIEEGSEVVAVEVEAEEEDNTIISNPLQHTLDLVQQIEDTTDDQIQEVIDVITRGFR